MTINALPDDVLLLIFHFDRVGHPSQHYGPWRWDRLVHVCRRWRSIVFASPNFLDLSLVCGSVTRVRRLGVWPPFPITITGSNWLKCKRRDLDALIVHRNRVRGICLLDLESRQLQRLASAMWVQFPALTHLRLGYSRNWHSPALALPDGFLGGSAPHLQSLELDFIPFPALPTFLLSSTNLVSLILLNIPRSGYISPQVIVTSLAALVNLESLTMTFEPISFLAYQGIRHAPPPTCTTLPVLTFFVFEGVVEYFEPFVSQIDVPLLGSIRILLLNQFVFDFPQLAQFMRRATRFQAPNRLHVGSDHSGFSVNSYPPIGDETPRLTITCGAGWKFLLRAQVFSSFLPSAYMVDHLYLHWSSLSAPQGDDYVEWLELIRSFTAVKNVYVCKELATCIALALKKLVGERITDVLPALENLFFEGLQPSGLVQETIEPFVSARQLLGHPVAVSRWNKASI